MSDEFTDKYTDIKPELVFQPFEDKVDDMKTKEEKEKKQLRKFNLQRKKRKW